MQFSESWLRQFVNPPLSTEELEHTLTMSGLEVEEMKMLAPPFSKIVIAEILEATQHPDADRLRVCKVNVGEIDGVINPLQIVCGAPNARVGIKIPCALVGAVLPPSEPDGKPFLIKIGKLRGVESFGMLCSGKELGLGDDHAGIYELPIDAPVGKNIREYLNLDDTLFTIKLTPNKADCLSVMGIARDLSAVTGSAFMPNSPSIIKSTIDDKLKIRVEEPELCGRFSGRVMRGVNAKVPTPQWMVSRLASAGQRSISALVDISNYVMLEVGQPTHVFDLHKIQGDITVRWGHPGESVKLLNGQTIQISDIKQKIGVIASGNEIESLAGIMGGDHTAVNLDTTDIFVESAYWLPNAIQGRARELNFSTDAAYRFERGVDPMSVVKCLDYVVELIQNICGGQVGPVTDQLLNMPKTKQIKLRVSRVEKIIGVAFSGNQIAEYFDRSQFSYTRQHPGEIHESFVVEAPSYRFDLEIEEDLIEEIARLYGFENIPEVVPSADLSYQSKSETKRSIHQLRHQVAAQDYQEVVNYGFIDRSTESNISNNLDHILVVNPLAEQFGVMRSSLLGGLLNNLKTNINRKVSRVRLFEIGRVFLKSETTTEGPLQLRGINQPTRLGGLAYGLKAAEQWGQKTLAIDFFDVKSDIANMLSPLKIETRSNKMHPAFHPGRCADIFVVDDLGQATAIGLMGELHPKWQQYYDLPLAPMMFEIDWLAVQDQHLPKPQEVSKFQAVERDLAIVVNKEVVAQDILDAMYRQIFKDRAQKRDHLIKSIILFDEFRPSKDQMGGLNPDQKSLAFRVTLLDEGQTLQDSQVEESIKTLLDQVLVQFSAHLR